MMKVLIGFAVLFWLIPSAAWAHCPLCTVGAGALAVGAAYLGISVVIVGVLIGAFAVALGLWVPTMIKRQYIPYQRPIVAIIVILSTILPLIPLIQESQLINVFLAGPTGSWLNRTYSYNRFLVGTIIGGAIMAASPGISAALTIRRQGQLIPYQGMIITLGLIAIVSLIIQFWLV